MEEYCYEDEVLENFKFNINPWWKPNTTLFSTLCGYRVYLDHKTHKFYVDTSGKRYPEPQSYFWECPNYEYAEELIHLIKSPIRN